MAKVRTETYERRADDEKDELLIAGEPNVFERDRWLFSSVSGRDSEDGCDSQDGGEKGRNPECP